MTKSGVSPSSAHFASTSSLFPLPLYFFSSFSHSIVLNHGCIFNSSTPCYLHPSLSSGLFYNKPFNILIQNGHVYLAQPPLFKINKGSKGIYIKDEKELEHYILNNSKELKKIKKGSKEFNKKLQEEKLKISIQRFKGLGEMNPEELWQTTLNPETRNLLQVQYSKDLKKDHDLIHTLMGNDVSLRKDFIVENAINVLNLDI